MSDERLRAEPGPGRVDRRPPQRRHAGARRRHRRHRKPGKGSRIGAIVVLVLIVASLAWYFVADRLTPVHLAGAGPGLRRAGGRRGVGQGAEGARQEQRRGAARAAAVRHRSAAVPIALQRSRSDYESVRLSVSASNAAVRRPRRRCRRPRPIASAPSRTRRGWNRSTRRIRARSRCAASRAAQASPQSRRAARRRLPRRTCAARWRPRARAATRTRSCISARSAIEKAELDLKRTEVRRAVRRPGDRPADRRRPVRAGRRAGDDADRRCTTCGSAPT